MSSQNIYILGIESSCDDTAASVIYNGCILSNVVATQKIHEEYGGVVPELASRAHQQNIVPVVHQALKKANITPVQCSTGFRVAKIMQRLGITEDQFESFMSDVYDRCQKLQLGPDQIEKYLTETINLKKHIKVFLI